MKEKIGGSMKEKGTARNFPVSRGAAIAALAGFLLLSGLAATLFAATEEIPDEPLAPGSNAADRVLGQPDFIHNAPNSVDPSSMNRGGHVAVDTSVTPNRLYVADQDNSRVLGYNNVTALTTGAPADLVIGQPDLFASGCNTGGVSANSLCSPKGLAVDSLGRLYVADFSNHRVLRYDAPFSPGGTTAQAVFGQGDSFFAGGCNNFGSQPTADSLCNPVGVALNSAGNLFVADFGNHRVLQYNTPLTDTTANFVFGQGGDFTTGICNKGGLGPTTLCGPAGVVLDSLGNLYVADFSNHRVLEYDAPLTATPQRVFGQGGSFFLNFCNNGGLSANSLCNPDGIALDSAGNLYVADSSFGNNRVLEYDSPLTNTTATFVFGQGGIFTIGGCNQGGLSADSLCNPTGVGADSSGNVYIVDRFNARVLKYDTPLITGITTASVVLGQFDFTHNSPNTVDADGFFNSIAVAVDKSVSPNRLYIADSRNHRVLGYLNAATFSSGAPADLVIGQPDFLVGLPNNGGLNASSLSNPRGVAVDIAGNLYVADSDNHRVLQYTNPFAACGAFPCVGGPAAMVFGQGEVFTTNGCNQGGLSEDSLCNPQGVGVDSAGNFFVADQSNHRVLAFPPGVTTASVVFGQAGDFTTGVCNQGGLSPRSLCNPTGVALDSDGNLFVADQSNSRVLGYNTPFDPNPAANRVFGQLGSFTINFCNNGGVSANSLCLPFGVAVDNSVSPNRLYIADTNNHRVLEYNPPFAANPMANFVFGQNGNFTSGSSNLGGTRPSRRTLFTPNGVAVDALGNVLIADFNNNRVLEYDTPIP